MNRVLRWRQRTATTWRTCVAWAERAPLRFSLLAALALLATAVVVLRPSYETNDDVFMTMIASGRGFCPAPDEHLIFSNILIGRALRGLYTALPSVPWYGGYLLTVHFLAQAAFLFCLLRQPRGERRDLTAASPDGRRLGLYLAFFALVELPLLNSLQFTSTAFLAAMAGTGLLLSVAVRATTFDAIAALEATAGAALWALAGLIRLESFLMALLIAAPLGLALVRRVRWRTAWPCGATAGAALLVIALATAHDRAAYATDPRWSDFFAYNQLRVKFNDYGWTSYSPATADIFHRVGWSENDHAMIAHWFFDEPNLYSQEHLRAVLDAYPWKAHRLTANYWWQLVRGPLRDRSVWAVMLALPFFLAGARGVPHERRIVGVCAAVAAALIVFLTWNNKLPPARVYFPLLSFPLAVALLLRAMRPRTPETVGAESTADRDGILDDHAFSGGRPWKSRVAIVMLVVGLVMALHHQGRRTLRVFRERQNLAAFLQELQPTAHKLLVCWEAAMPFELISPLDNLGAWSQTRLVNLVWTQRTPWQEEIKRQFQIDDLATAIATHDDVILIATPAHRALFATFAKEHQQRDVEFAPTAQVGDKLVAGRFQPAAGSGVAIQPSGPSR